MEHLVIELVVSLLGPCDLGKLMCCGKDIRAMVQRYLGELHEAPEFLKAACKHGGINVVRVLPRGLLDRDGLAALEETPREHVYAMSEVILPCVTGKATEAQHTTLGPVLQTACECGDAGMVENVTKVTMYTKMGRKGVTNQLHASVTARHSVDVIKALCLHADPRVMVRENDNSNTTMTPLQKAIEVTLDGNAGWCYNVCKALLDLGVNVNHYRVDEYTALHWAMQHKLPAVVELLLDRGANVTHSVDGFEDCLDFAAHIGDADILRMVRHRARKLRKMI